MSNTYTCTTIHTSREAQQDGGHSRMEDTAGRRTAQYRTEDSTVQDGGQQSTGRRTAWRIKKRKSVTYVITKENEAP